MMMMEVEAICFRAVDNFGIRVSEFWKQIIKG